MFPALGIVSSPLAPTKDETAGVTPVLLDYYRSFWAIRLPPIRQGAAGIPEKYREVVPGLRDRLAEQSEEDLSRLPRFARSSRLATLGAHLMNTT